MLRVAGARPGRLRASAYPGTGCLVAGCTTGPPGPGPGRARQGLEGFPNSSSTVSARNGWYTGFCGSQIAAWGPGALPMFFLFFIGAAQVSVVGHNGKFSFLRKSPFQAQDQEMRLASDAKICPSERKFAVDWTLGSGCSITVFNLILGESNYLFSPCLICHLETVKLI